MSNRIKELRKKNKLFQEDLAKYADVTQGAVSSWEKNLYKPNEQQLLKLCELFNCTPDYLMGYSDINLKDTSSNANKLTLRGRNGRISEYILTDEEMEAYEKIFQNREKYRSKNDGNF